jgi:hypothetical protein
MGPATVKTNGFGGKLAALAVCLLLSGIPVKGSVLSRVQWPESSLQASLLPLSRLLVLPAVPHESPGYELR